MVQFRTGLTVADIRQGKSSGPFEAGMLPLTEKERLCRELLEEFGIKVHSVRAPDSELIIPCRVGPNHKNQDREPSAALNYDKLTFKCLGCKASGGLLWFIAEHRGTSSTEARDWLAKETGTDGQLMDLSALLRYFDSLYGKKAAAAPMPSYSDQMLEPWALIHPWVTDPPEYDGQGRNVGGRGIPEETALRFKVGYAENYPYYKDQTSERIVIPHYWKDRLVGWQSRRLANDGTAKYKSSPDFPKDQTIFGYDPRQHKVAVVVESPFSTLRHEHHIHMPATFGANVTEAQVRLLGRYEKVIFWFDNDHAGWGAYEDTRDNRGNVVEFGLLEKVSQMTSVWAVDSDFNADPADLDDTLAQSLVDACVPWPLWKPPRMLICPRCEREAHAGGCG